MLMRTLRYTRGYVRFTVAGPTPERFIDCALRAGVRLWDMTKTSEGLSACMYMASYLRIAPLASRAGVRLRIARRYGLPTFIKRYRGKIGAAAGAFAFIIAVFIMSQFIWSIDITGLGVVSESEMGAMLREHGLYIGAFKPALDSGTVSRGVMLEDGRIGWMAVNITGSYASVEVKEESPAPGVPDINEPCNVKAARDGVIISISAGEGEVLLKEGSGVVEGQLIVSGVAENLDGSSRLVRAEATVMASTFYSAEFSVPISAELTVPMTEAGERRRLSLFGMELPLSACAPESEYVCAVDRYDVLSPLETDLPVGIVTERLTAMEKRRLNSNYNSAKESLEKQARLYEVFSLKDCTVTDRRYSLRQDGDRYVLTADLYCTEDIARQEIIGVRN